MAEERPRSAPPAERFGAHREVEKLEVRSAVLLGHDETRDSHLDEALPQRGVVPGVALEDLAQVRRGQLVREQLLDGLLQQFLFFREIEIHCFALLSAFAKVSRGRPSPRSPTTLR